MSDVPPVAAAERGWPASRLKLLLVLSLAVNLLLIGLIAGSAFMWKKHGPGRGAMRGEDFGLLGFTRQLPAERRGELGKRIRAERAKLKPLHEEVREAREAAVKVLSTEPYDVGALKAAIERITAAEGRLKTAGLDIFLTTAADLTADERKALAAWWAKRVARRGPPRDKDGAPDEPPPPPE